MYIRQSRAILALLLVAGPRLAPRIAVAQEAIHRIEIQSSHAGWGSNAENILVRREKDNFARGGATVDPASVQRLADALKALKITRADMMDLGITRNWLQEVASPAPSSGLPKQRARQNSLGFAQANPIRHFAEHSSARFFGSLRLA